MRTIGIIGKGFVGTAVYEGMKHAFDIMAYDKIKGWSFTLGEKESDTSRPWPEFYDGGPYVHILRVCDGPIFLCLPSPMAANGSCDISIIEEVVTELNDLREGMTKSVIVLKSTLVPGTTEKLNAKYPNLLMCYNPEFLTERNAVNDFKNQNRIILGGPHEATTVVKQMYEMAYPAVPVTKTHSTVAELVKYLTNCFLAVKTSFANEIKQICDGLSVDYDKVIEYALKDERLGKSHWSVPGPDGTVGWGGKCFPKDLNALKFLAEELGVAPLMLEAAWRKNLEVRDDHDWERIPGAVSCKD